MPLVTETILNKNNLVDQFCQIHLTNSKYKLKISACSLKFQWLLNSNDVKHIWTSVKNQAGLYRIPEYVFPRADIFLS